MVFSNAISRISSYKKYFEISGPAHNRLLPMEGLRGIAVLLVFLVHYTTLIYPWLRSSSLAPFASSLHQLGNIGVDQFFVLSGFLIYGTLIRKPKPFLGFMRRRIERLYPTFLVVFSVYLLLSGVLPQESKLPSKFSEMALYIVENILMLPGMLDIPPLVTVAWSLSYDLFFYISVPLLIALLQMRRWPWWVRAVAIFCFMQFWQYYEMPRPRLIMFAAGMILAEIIPYIPHLPRFLKVFDYVALVTGLSCLVVICQFGFQPPVVTLLWISFVMIGIGSFSHFGLLHFLLSLRPLRMLGNMSYSYYLIHGLALKAFFAILPLLTKPDGSQGALFPLLLGPCLLITVGVSCVLYLLVEYPYSIAVPESPAVITDLAGMGVVADSPDGEQAA